MTRRLTPLLLAVLLALSGCMGGWRPSLADGPLVEKWRLAVSQYDGHTLWEQPGTQAIADTSYPDPRAFVARCAKPGCDITARDQSTGQVLWRRHFAEPVTMTAAGETMGGFYLLGDRTLALVNTSDGRTRWSLARPPGAHQTMLASLYRAIIFTPPALPGCTATFRGVDAGRILWTRTVRWHDAGAPGAPCSYDPARLMVEMTDPEIPVAPGPDPGPHRERSPDLPGRHGPDRRRPHGPRPLAVADRQPGRPRLRQPLRRGDRHPAGRLRPRRLRSGRFPSAASAVRASPSPRRSRAADCR